MKTFLSSGRSAIALALILVAATAMFAVLERRRAADDERLRSELGRIRRDVAVLSDDLPTSTPQRVPLGRPPSPAAAVDERARGESEDPDPSHPVHRPRFSTEEIPGVLGAAFTSEAVDNSWAGQTTRDVRAKFVAASGPGSSVGSISCKSTMCRVEMEHNGLDDDHTFFDRLLEQPTDMAVIVPERINGADGHVRAVIYLARDGFPFPI